VTCYNAAGQVVRESNTLGSISYQYNNNGLVSGVTEVIAGASYALSYAYNAAGQVTTVTYPDAKILTYVYDNQGRPGQVKLGGTTLLAFTYNLDDTITSKSECNGNSTVAYTYNFRSWVSTIKAKDKAGAVFLDMTYTYDAVGNVKSIANAAGAAGTETYTYDRLDRLTKAVGAWGTYQYGYNAVGDRIWANEGVNRTYAYGRYSNLTSDGVYHYDYDRNGNVIWKNDTALTTRYNYLYNSFGQMTQAVKWTRSGSAWSSSIMANYSYDAAGARARTVEGNATTDFVYAGHDALLQVGADGKYVKYVYAGGLQLRVVAVGETYSYIADALGSTRFVLKNGNKDAANIMFSALTYRPFGGAVTVYSADRITFAGEAQDSTGLVYLSARYYDPAIGRFYALDPELGRLGMPQTLDRYVYCVNNPLRYTDPSGMFIPLLFIGAIIASSLFFGGANAAIAYASGGDVGSAFAGGLVEGALLPTPFAPVAGIAGAATQFYLDDGSFSESDLAFMGLAAIPIPSIGRAGKALFSEGGDAAARSLAKSRLEQALPEGYERAAELLHRSGKYDGLAGRSAQVRHSILGNYMHDAMGEIAERDGISKYTRRGLGGADFHGDGYWLDLSTKYTWPKSLQRQNAYNALYRGSGDVIFYDPQEVLRCYERIYMG
jgi:RHS repeat-associated protein